MRIVHLCAAVLAGLSPVAICNALPNAKLIAASGMQAQLQMPWDQPPPEFKDMERRGFQDGVHAEMNDFNHRREPDPERRKEFRNPHVQRSFQGDYRKGFRRGYDDAMRHMERSKGSQS